MVSFIGQETVPLGVVLERRPSAHPWLDYSWRPVAVIPGAAAVDPKGGWPELLREGETVRYHAGTLPLSLYRRETDGYLLNLTQQPPRVFVVLRRGEAQGAEGRDLTPFHVTACALEAQTYADTNEDIVEPVAMPEALVAWIRDFVERHHIEEPKHKRKRQPAVDPAQRRQPFEPPPESPPRDTSNRSGER